MRLSFTTAGLATLALVLYTGVASANPRPLPFTYQHEQLAAGATEIEQFVDLTPVRATDALSGDPAWYGLTQFQTEIEHGITDRLELGLYLTIAPGPPQSLADVPRPMEGNGMKQRLRYQLAPTGQWPLDVSLYGEISETDHEIEFEAKVILQRRIGIARIIANAMAEQELYYDGQRDFVIRPTAGVTFEASPSVQPGIEWWMSAEFHENSENSALGTREFPGPHQYLGPALLLQFGNVWWTTGIYARLSDTGHTLVPGEAFGNLWVRSVVGVGL
jgi:hypothetical protein